MWKRDNDRKWMVECKSSGDLYMSMSALSQMRQLRLMR